MEQGKAMPYALDTIQTRGKLFVGPGEEVYGGQIVGENPRKEDMPVNPAKAKQLDNMRASGSDKGIQLAPPIQFSLERAIEYIAPDELVEATPNFLRMRKRILDANVRRKMAKTGKTSCAVNSRLGRPTGEQRDGRCGRTSGLPIWPDGCHFRPASAPSTPYSGSFQPEVLTRHRDRCKGVDWPPRAGHAPQKAQERQAFFGRTW